MPEEGLLSSGRCAGCGREPRELRDGLCLPCEAEWLAKRKPDRLGDMELISLGMLPSTNQQMWLADFRDKKPSEFLKEFRTLEREYNQRLAAQAKEKPPQPSSSPGSSTCIPYTPDEGSLRVLDLIERVLTEVGAKTRRDLDALQAGGGRGLDQAGDAGLPGALLRLRAGASAEHPGGAGEGGVSGESGQAGDGVGAEGEEC